MEEKKFNVFISYSRKDYVDENDNVLPNSIITKIKDTFSNNDISYWFDEEGIYSGEDFASDITIAIRNSNIFLFVSSENSNQSRWTSNEISIALEYKKPIIPFLLDDSPFNDSVMGKIASFDRIRCVNENKALQKLLKSIHHHLPKEPKKEPKETTVLHIVKNEGSSSVKSIKSQETTNTEDSGYRNELSITITDQVTPIVVFVGPSNSGKTMAFIRLVRYVKDIGLLVQPDRFFRSSDDSLCDNIRFLNWIYSDIASPATGISDCILTKVTDVEGNSILQMVDLSGEFILQPDKTPHYWYQIVRSKNPIIWIIFAEMDGMSVDERERYVQRIGEIKHRYISSTDKTIIIASKIDKSPFVQGKSQFDFKGIFNRTNAAYPGLMRMFMVSNPFKHDECTFVPFTSGDFTYDKEASIRRYVPSSDVYPKMLWEALLKSKKNGVGPRKISQWSIVLSIIAIVIAAIFGWRYYHHVPQNPIVIEDTICSPIDLDLPSGTLWADRNVGAKMSSDFGDLFAWGEIEPKDDYSKYTYVEQLKPSIQISKAKHDAALTHFGPDWSIPTEKHFQELLSECTWKWAQMNGNRGYKIIGKNGKQIFLPATGCYHDTIVEFENKRGFYWTSERSIDSRFARSLQFSNDGKRSIENGYLHNGYSIRAVYTEVSK